MPPTSKVPGSGGAPATSTAGWRGRTSETTWPRSRSPDARRASVDATPLISGGYVSVTRHTRRATTPLSRATRAEIALRTGYRNVATACRRRRRGAHSRNGRASQTYWIRARAVIPLTSCSSRIPAIVSSQPEALLNHFQEVWIHADHEPPNLPPVSEQRRGRRGLPPEHRTGAGDPGAQPHRHHPRRRAHRHPDAGEPRLRSLLRHAARRARLRRPATDDLAVRAARMVSAGRRGLPAAVPSHRRRLRPGVSRGHATRLVGHARGLEQRPVRSVDPHQGAEHDGVLHAGRHSVFLLSRRRVHDLRCVSLL